MKKLNTYFRLSRTNSKFIKNINVKKEKGKGGKRNSIRTKRNIDEFFDNQE